MAERQRDGGKGPGSLFQQLKQQLPLWQQAAVVAGGSSQRRSQRQQGKTPATHDKCKDCEYVTMPGELVQQVVEACASWPEGQAGELEGVVRLLGGGMTNARGST